MLKDKKDLVIRVSHYAFLIVVLLSLSYVLWAHKAYDEDMFVFDEECIEEWNDGWELNYNGDISYNVSLPLNITDAQESTLILRKNLPDKIKKYNCIMLSGNRQDIFVSIGGIQREAFSNKDFRPWGKTGPSGVIMVPIYNTDSLADVAIHISSDSFFSGKIGKIYLGTEKSLLIMLLKNNMLLLFLTAIVLIIGVVCSVCFAVYRNYFKISRAMHYLSIFAILSAVWSFSHSGIRQLFIQDLTTLEAIGYSCYMLTPIPYLLYVNWIVERRYEFATKCCALFVMLNYTIENILVFTLHIGYFDMRDVSEMILIGSLIYVLIICYFEKRNEGITTRHLIIGSIGLLVGALSEFSIVTVLFRQKTFGLYIVGAFIALCSGFVFTVVCIGREQQQKKDAESANLAKSLFLATMSHEIKTPINAVLGMNELILRDSRDEQVREYAENINSAGKSLLALVNDILDFSKIESGKMDIVCVNYQIRSLLRDLIIMTETRIKENALKLVLDLDESIPSTCYGDEIRIKQVVTNLLTNAAKYTKKGEIKFSVKNLGLHNDEVKLYFSIKDTGIGIKEEDISRFMDSFVRLDQVKNSSIEGTGLGLTITTQLLELMGGKLEVDSVYGEGSDFHFVITQKVIDSTPMGALSNKIEPKKKKRKITFTAPDVKVLAVDDNRTNLTVLAGVLKPANMQIDTCLSGSECIEMCKNTTYDVILMDHMMPGMDGIEAFKILKESENFDVSRTKVIVVTANTVSGVSEMYAECGFDYYLKKPININELNEVMQKYLPQDKLIPIKEE